MQKTIFNSLTYKKRDFKLRNSLKIRVPFSNKILKYLLSFFTQRDEKIASTYTEKKI